MLRGNQCGGASRKYDSACPARPCHVLPPRPTFRCATTTSYLRSAPPIVLTGTDQIVRRPSGNPLVDRGLHFSPPLTVSEERSRA
jgi:hypothetical protein